MKWSKKADKDGAYLTYVESKNVFGMLVRKNSRWFCKIGNEVKELESVDGIDYFLRLVRPKR